MTTLVFLILAFGPAIYDGIHRRRGELVTLRSACLWSGVYVGSALLFALYLAVFGGPGDSAAFLAGWSIEKSLSVDNLLVFGAIFTYFGVKSEHQYRVLHFGIIGAVVLRLAFISFGLFMFAIFGRVLDIAFGAFVIWTAWKLYGGGDDAPEAVDHNSRWYIKWTRKIFQILPESSAFFFVRRQLHREPFTSKFSEVRGKGKLHATPLLLCLISIEVTDILFAFDSVPAVLGVTQDTLLVYSSIMFAVIGLRSLYFVLESVLRYAPALSKAMTGILLFIGLKLVLHGVAKVEVPPIATLLVVLTAFGCCIPSVVRKRTAE